MTHDEHMLTPDQVRDRVASAATRTVEPGRVSVLERLQQERDTSARLADQVNELGEELADLREENAGLKVENQELRARHRPTSIDDLVDFVVGRILDHLGEDDTDEEDEG